MSVLYIYLGRRGGGAEFNRIMQEYLEGNLHHNQTFLNSYELKSKRVKQILIFTPVSLISIPAYMCTLIVAALKILKHQRKFKSVVLLMASPWDYPILRMLKYIKKRTIMVVHDFKPHPGEKWPTDRALNKRFDWAEKLVFLSQSTMTGYLTQNTHKPKKEICVIPHPVFELIKLFPRVNSNIPKNNYVLFVGRISDYKGLSVLNSALRNIQNSQLNVIIAGAGNIQDEFPEFVEIRNWWLSEEELMQLVENSSCVVFPYIEASQSGFIPICIKLNKYLIISDVEGLKEQTIGYANQSIFPRGNAEALAKLLENGVKKDWKFEDPSKISDVTLKTEHEFARELHEFVSMPH
jgi:glycosyltransferase involved in cell wall biosynthesis